MRTRWLYRVIRDQDTRPTELRLGVGTGARDCETLTVGVHAAVQIVGVPSLRRPGDPSDGVAFKIHPNGVAERL